MNEEDEAERIRRDIDNGLHALEGGTSMRRERPYDGQPWTDNGKRGSQLVEGLTMRDVRDCFVRAVLQSSGAGPFYGEADKGENAALSAADMFEVWDRCDPVAVSQNLTCEIERMMGIFPNLDREVCDRHTAQILSGERST